MSPSDNVTKLMTELVLVGALQLDLFVFTQELLFCVACMCLVVVVADDQNVDINPVESKLS